ncbi:TIGR00341 family protein [Psychrobacter vallis]|uniref:TIGR00341 family protein n=1 Tax=Psychrobacter vallis TaxID=248451 RepID=UPI001D102464|nr:TIGR00341 family protein [Psychrobacter vallis]
MTSSEKSAAPDSSNLQNSSTSTDRLDNQDTLPSTVADAAVIDDPEMVEDKDLACTQDSEANIVIESISEDVAVATLEPSESESTYEESVAIKSESDFFQVEAVNAAETSSANSPETETALETEDSHPIDEQNTSIEQADKSSANRRKADDNAKNKNTTQVNHIPTASQDENTDVKDIDVTDNAEPLSDKEEEVKEEKEAKLESYKQFVAEQFSKQKVDYPEVRVRIEANALPTRMYFVMNALSAIIASYGLITNSAAVVIGAMLVAMMLGPITGVALAVIDYRMPLLRKSLFAVAAGVLLVILVGFIIGLLHSTQPLTAEILSRTQPTSMDLMIALAGGTAGAYAMVSPHLSVAVVGVAVATALVPPLAASGILFANGEIKFGFGALLLAVTNIVAIQFTNALVLWVLGFRRLVDDDYKSNTYLTFLQRNAVTLLLLGGLGTYLTINLHTNAKQQMFENNVKETINTYFVDKGNVLTNTQFDTADENQVVRAIIRGETTPSSYDVRQIESTITLDMKENFPDYLPIKVQLRYLPVQVIESHPLIQDKLDETDAAILTN